MPTPTLARPLPVCAAALALLTAGRAFAFEYAFATDAQPARVVHPIGYAGAGGPLTLTVGVDPTSAFAGQMLVSTQNVVNTYNGLLPANGNLQPFGISAQQYDFESVLLHEMGHALGLDHPNFGAALPANDRYTRSGVGGNGVNDLGPGPDGVIGTADDARGDDTNLNWFRTATNNPFAIAPVVDSTTYSRNLTALPAGDSFSAQSSRENAATKGLANTEAVMVQGTFNGEVQRSLGFDDVAGIKYAESGLDERAGTADDYTVLLRFTGLDGAADITVDFDDSQTGFAVTGLQAIALGGGSFDSNAHVALTGQAKIYFNSTPGLQGFFFNQQPNQAVPEPAAMAALAGAGLLLLRRRRAV